MNPYEQWQQQQQQQQQQQAWQQQQQAAMAAQQANPFAQAGAGARVTPFMTRVYQWMTLAVALTAAIAMIIGSLELDVLQQIFQPAVLIGMTIGMIGLSFALQAFAHKMSAPVAFVLFFLYATLMGVWLGPIFKIFAMEDIAGAFFSTAGMFGAATVYGYVTKKDLSGLGGFLLMALFGLIIASIVNLIMQSEMLYWIISGVGVVLFTALTAYDTQKIKEAGEAHGANPPAQIAVQGATILYVDFINIFIYMLRILNALRD